MQNDTSPEAARVRLAALRSISGVARLDQALELSDSVRAMADAGARARELAASQGDAAEPTGEAD